MTKTLRIALKTLLWVLGSVILILVLVVLLLQVPAVQNMLRKKAVTYLEDKLGTKVEIGYIYLDFPSSLNVKNVYLEDQRKDTLLYSKELEARLDLWKLFKKRLVVSRIDWQGVTAKISRTKDSVYNFDYIVAAFADSTAAPSDTSSTSSGFAIDLDRINLDQIQLIYNDSAGQNYVHFYVGHFDTRISDFDLDKMQFGIPQTHLSNVRANIQQLALSQAAPVADTATSPLNMQLSIGQVDLSKILMNYHSPEMDAGLDLGRLLVDFDKIDLPAQKIAVHQILLDTTTALIKMRNPTTVTEVVSETAKHIDTLITPATSAPWSFALQNITLRDNRVRFDNEGMPVENQGLDYGHMDVRDINFQMKDFWFISDSMQGNIAALSLKDKSGFAVDSLSGRFFYGPRSASLKDFFLKLPHSELQDQLAVTYPSLDAVALHPELLGLSANIQNSYVGMQDILMVAPFLSAYPAITNFATSRVRLKAKLEGKVGNLNIPTLELSGLGLTSLKASGRLIGLPDPEKTFMDLGLQQLHTTSQDITKMMPVGIMPEGYTLPAQIQASGHFKGTISQFNTEVALTSSEGDAHFKGQIDMRYPDKETYQGNLTTHELNIGRMAGMQDMIGKISLQTELKGESFNPKKASLALNGVIQALDLKGYHYQDLRFNAAADQGRYQLKAALTDPNIRFNLAGTADLTGQAPVAHLDLQLDSADFQALHLSTDTLKLHTNLQADFASADPDSLNGAVNITNLILLSGANRLQADSISFVSTANTDSCTLHLDAASLGLTAAMQGQYQLTKLAPAFQQLFNRYMAVDSLASLPGSGNTNVISNADSLNQSGRNKKVTAHLTQTALAKPTAASATADTALATHFDSTGHQAFSFNARIFKTPMLSAFVPDLKRLDTIAIQGRFDNREPVLDITGDIPAVVYGTDTLTGGVLQLLGDKNKLSYQAGFKRIAVGNTIELNAPSIAGAVRDNQLTAILNVLDNAGKPYYKLGGSATITGTQLRMSLLPDSLLLDYTPWKVQPGNYIQYDSSGILIHNFSIADQGQQLSVQSDPALSGAPIKVNFKDFKIETLTKIVNQDSVQVGGTLSGQATLDSVMTSPLFTADMNIQDLNFKSDTIGNIALNIDNKSAGKYQTHVAITGQGNQVDLSGAYYGAPESRMDFVLDINKLALKSIESLTLGYLKNMSGSLDGLMAIKGSFDKPDISGQLHFNQAAFNVAMLNAPFVIPDENVRFDDQGIIFDKVQVLDQQKNRLTIDGRIKTSNYMDYGFGLRVRARDFQVINSTKVDNPLYYGKLYMDAAMNINGTMDAPVVDGTIGVRDKTSLTIVVPSADPSVEQREGVVEFVKLHQEPNLDSILVQRQLDSLRNTAVQGMDISATINVDKNALFSIVLDERNGDMVKLRGEAHLNGGIDPSGKTSLTGTYEVNDGSYNLSYATVKRNFKFKQGSTIVWTGDPTSANVDLTAVYIANVPPLDLVEHQLTGTENTVQFKQKLPFEVNLMMKDELLKPQISFDIKLPDDNSKVNVSSEVTNAVNTRLAQIRMDPNEMNKQVLGVLVLGHFIGDNPLQSMVEGQTMEGAIRNSVSSLLSDQLNRLADNLISGVDLDFGLTSGEDYSSGTATNRTDLNVGLSKNFLNDRLTVSVGNNFNLEGAQAGEKATSIAGNVSIGYKLSRDGRYLLRAYRNDHFIVIQGQVIETGIGFSMTLDYDRFKEILKGKTERQKQWRKQFRQRQKEQKQQKEQQLNTGSDSIYNTNSSENIKDSTENKIEAAGDADVKANQQQSTVPSTSLISIAVPVAVAPEANEADKKGCAFEEAG